MKKQLTVIVSGLLVVLITVVDGSALADSKANVGTARRAAESVRGANIRGMVESDPITWVASITDCNSNGVLDFLDISDGTSLDCNGNEIPDECEVANRTTYAFSVDPAEAILDGLTLTRTFDVPDGGRIVDVDLGLSLTHEYLGDLVVTLTHGDTSVNIIYYGPCDACDTTCGFNGTNFDDEAEGQLQCIGLNEGSFLPWSPLSAFDGMDATGPWTLEIFDGFVGYEGSLTGWSLAIAKATENDCNLNAIPDGCELNAGTSGDCDNDGLLDECEIYGGSPDCNENGVPDGCDLSGGEPADQWASTVLGFSSQYTATFFSAEQALGPPNTPTYCDCNTAWAPSSADGTLEFISVGFADLVLADGVTIRETQGNGFVTRVELIDAQGGVHTAWEGEDPSEVGTPVDFRIDWPRTDFLVAGVTVHIDTNLQIFTWEEIDAIALHGAPTTSRDCNGNMTPDECEIAAGASDCNANGIPDDCDIAPLGPLTDQWVSEVIEFSSEAQLNPAADIIGAPDGLPWLPGALNDTQEFITVGYSEAAYATGVTIRESGAGIFQVELLDTNDVLHTIWQGVDPIPPGLLMDFNLTWPITSYAVKGVKLHLDTNHALFGEAIDSIALHGRLASDCNDNGVVDWCESGLIDCNANGTPDSCETNPDTDCNANGIPDDCDIAPLGFATEQWASHVIDFTSAYPGGEAIQALGMPDGLAWGSLQPDGQLEYITLGYDTPVYANGVTIREYLNPGFVHQVDVVDLSDQLHTVWSGVDPGGACCGVDVELGWAITSFEVKGVRVHVDTNTALRSRETIDAIRLHGLAGPDCNGNGTNDWCESVGIDCNGNGMPDVCDLLGNDHNCCEPQKGAPGCSDPDVEACVCKLLPACCQDVWDETCIEAVEFYNCDTCDFDVNDCNSNGILDECELGDFNGDNTLDLVDHGAFVRCLRGPLVLVSPDCEPGDFDCDYDVDLRDVAGFQVMMPER